MTKKISLLLILCLMAFSQIMAQKNIRSGEVNFKIDFQGLDEMTASFLSGSEMNLTFNKNYSKATMDMGMAKNITIYDFKEDKATVLIDAMGQKIKMSLSDEDMNEEREEPKFTKTDETKTIANLNCTKYLVETQDGKFDVYITEEIVIDPRYSKQFPGLKGFPMEYIMEENGMKMKLTANKVEKRDVKDNEFDIPDGYQEMKAEDLQKMMGG